MKEKHLSYEQAVKLKEAGFPHDWERFENHDPELLKLNWDMYGKGYCPTLSELIEACGDKFECVSRNIIEETSTEKYVIWRAYPTDGAYGGDCIVDCCGYEIGNTPEEAVANLWFELNKK